MTTSHPDQQSQVSQLQLILPILFAIAIVVANVTASKLAYFDLPLLGGVAVPAGFVAIGVAFLVSDLMVELYGKELAHKSVNATVIGLGVAWSLIWIAIYLPVAPFYGSHEAYSLILGSSGTIIIASITTVLVSQHIDVSIFHRIRNATNNDHRWLRNLGSTSISQFIDTVLFISLAFAILPYFLPGEPIFGMTLVTLIAGQYTVKLFVAIMDTPLFYLVTSISRRRHQISNSIPLEFTNPVDENR